VLAALPSPGLGPTKPHASLGGDEFRRSQQARIRDAQPYGFCACGSVGGAVMVAL